MSFLENQVVRSLALLQTHELSATFVQSVEDFDFAEDADFDQSDFDEFTAEFETPLKDLLRNAVNACKELLKKDASKNLEGRQSESSTNLDQSSSANESVGGQFWLTLCTEGVITKHLLAFLYGVVYKGKQKRASIEEKNQALMCASLYFSLISIPGSSAFKIFHTGLFQFMLSTLTMGCCPVMQRKRQGKNDKSAKRKARSKRKKTGSKEDSELARQSQQLRETDEASSCASSDESDEIQLTSSDVTNLKTLSVRAVHDLVTCMSVFSFKTKKEVVDNLVHCLCKLTLADEYTNVSFEYLDTSDVRSICSSWSTVHLSYYGLKLLCQPTHGNLKDTFLCIAKYLMPTILMNQVSSNTISKHYQLLKEQATNFLCHLVSKVKEGTYVGAQILIQHLCVRVTEKAEFRSQVAVEVVRVMKTLPLNLYLETMQWLYNFVRSSKISNRLFGIELFSKLLEEPERQMREPDVANNIPLLLQHRFLLCIIIQRVNDRASSVSTKALNILVSCLSSPSMHMKDLCKEFFLRCINGHQDSLVIRAENAKENLDANNRLQDRDDVRDVDQDADEEEEEEGPPQEVLLPCGCQLEKMLLEMCEHSKVYVRKAAIQLLEGVLCMSEDISCSKLVQAISTRILDPAVFIRKQVLQSLTNILLTFSSSEMIQRQWAANVLPLILDPETSVQEKTLEVLEFVVVGNLVSRSQANKELAWKILEYIAGFDNQDLQRYLLKSVCLLVKNGTIRPRLFSALKHEVGGVNESAFWLLASQMALYCEIPDPSFLLSYWQHCYDNLETVPLDITKHLLEVLGCTAKNLGVTDLMMLKDTLEKPVMEFNLPPELIGTAVETLDNVYTTLRKKGKIGRKDVIFINVLKACDRLLSSVMLDPSVRAEGEFEEKVVRHIVTIGEVTQLLPKKNIKRFFILVQSMTMSETAGASGDRGKEDQPPSSVPRQLSQTSFQPVNLGHKIRAHAFVTLGKILLQDEVLAKKAVPALARELETSDSDIIRNNICIILSDLCVRYTILVDPYIPSLTMCLRDPSTLVRRQTLTIITHLLQEDYVKCKGSLFFHLLFTLIDEDPDVSSLANYCLGHLLPTRHPGIFSQNFIGCIFYFNCYEHHGTYQTFPQSEREIRLFSLKGKNKQEKRFFLYRFLLENMNDDQRLMLMSKLCQEILGGVVDETIPFNRDSQCIVRDTLLICSCEEMRLSSVKVPTQEELEDSEEMANVAIAMTKKLILSQVVKKTTVEVIVPIVISLKKFLENLKSPLLGCLMHFLRELLKNYKMEIKDILAGDQQLAKEIDFELRFGEQEGPDAVQSRVDSEASLQRPSARHDQPNPVSLPTVPQNSELPATPAANKSTPVNTAEAPTRSSGLPSAISWSVKKAQREANILRQNLKLTPRQRSLLAAEGTAETGTPKQHPELRIQLLRRIAEHSITTPMRTKKDQLAVPLRAISTPQRPIGSVLFPDLDELSIIKPHEGNSSELKK